jgi:ParB family transcriptional regulator, chromosome partitioning protein
MAEVVTCTRKEALLQSLIENIARTKPGSMDFARELKRLHDEGWDYKQIAKIACKSEEYIRSYIRLVEQGEERLIQGVESGVFPIKFAIQVASTDDSQIQGVLMDAFAKAWSRPITSVRLDGSSQRRAKLSRRSAVNRDYTVNQLQQDIAETTRVKTSYVREAKSKENRFMTLCSGVNTLFQDAALVELLMRPEIGQAA